MTGTRPASRRAGTRGRLPLVLLALLALACLLATLPLSLLSGQLGDGIVAVVIGIPCTAVGVVVARRQPGNPLGWLFLLTGSCLFISNDAGDYSYYVYRLGHRLPFGPAAYHSILLALLALSAAFIGRQLLSWRRSSGERRQQVKWLASGAAVAIVSLIVALPLSTFGTTTALLEWLDNLIWCGMAALPVSMGVAILRYRLYDIDRIISRTLAYAIVTGLLVGVYAALALAAGAVRFHGPVAVAAATLAAAALFNPLRRRVQRLVDHRFNRASYDADVTVAAFAARLQDAVELDAVRADLTGVVQDTLEPAHVRLWLAEPP